jgi:AraC-like DNA-binding protein
MVRPSLTSWNTKKISSSSRYDAWIDTINQSYGSWTMGKPQGPAFDARLDTANIGNLTIHDCICDPCNADRTGCNIGQDDDFFAIQLVLSGKEHMCFDDQAYVLKEGDIFVWDSTRPMTFDVKERLHKISLVLPLDRLKDWMPNAWQSLPRKLSTDSASNILLRSLITGITGGGFYRNMVNDKAVSEAVIAALASGLDTSEKTRGQSIRLEQLARLQDYIRRHLHDSDMDISSIAKANRISVRYLHWVFSESGNTASNYILQQRLEACRKDLLNPIMNARSVAEIAYMAGFSNPAHFSKRYRQFYSESPSESRQLKIA